MKLLKNLSVGLLILLLLVVGIGFLLPSQYRVERSVVINASMDDIYPSLSDFRRWPQWAVWFERDPQMTVEYTGDMGQVGAVSRWKSASQGNGEMELLAANAPKRVVYALRFADMGMESTGELVLTATATGTEVKWADYGDMGMNPVSHYFALMMDNLIGPDLQQGLDNLKQQYDQQ